MITNRKIVFQSNLNVLITQKDDDLERAPEDISPTKCDEEEVVEPMTGCASPVSHIMKNRLD